jgi:transposase InsO family protein
VPAHNHVVARADFEVKLVARMTEIAAERSPWGLSVGARRPGRRGPAGAEGLHVARHGRNRADKGRRVRSRRCPQPAGARSQSRWSYDFVSDHTIDCGELRIVNVIDECTPRGARQSRRPAHGCSPGHAVPRQAVRSARRPALHPRGTGREFIADHVRDWLKERGVTPVHIEKDRRQQNCYIERFNGTMRNELLDGETLHSVLEARVVIDEFLDLYDTRRPHRGLGMKTAPAADGKDNAQRAER